MSNQLSIPSKPKFLAQQGDSPATLAEFSGGVTGGLALPMLSIRSKVFRARLDGQEQELSKTRDLQLILVAARPYVSKRYYEGAYQSGSTDAPDCSSLDGKTPDAGDNRQSEKCATCPHNVFGSKGAGKACADYKRLVVLPLVNGKAVSTPCILDVPATSLKTPKAMRGGTDLMLKEYMNTLARHQIDPTTVVSTISFTGAEYPQISWSFARYVEEDEHGLVHELRGSDEVQEVLGEDVHEEASAIAPAEETPVKVQEPAKKAAPKQEAKAEPEPEPEKEPEPAAGETPEPEEPETPAETEEEAGDDDDVMAEVNKLLKGMN
ncbi:MAG: hypothetical protein K0U78_13470 [Actinomycetia bacterium]|nr:hypothetical protein [Actinomycetes bacterium]